MPGNSVKVTFDSGVSTYVTPRKARQLENAKMADVVSRQPYVLRMKEVGQRVTRWSSRSGGRILSGTVLMKKLPRL